MRRLRLFPASLASPGSSWVFVWSWVIWTGWDSSAAWFHFSQLALDWWCPWPDGDELEDLSGLTGVQRLDVSLEQDEHDDVVTLRAGLGGLPRLRQLSLRGRIMSVAIAVAAQLGTLAGSSELDQFLGQIVDDEDDEHRQAVSYEISALLPGLTGLSRLDLSGAANVSSLAPLSGLTALSALSLRNCARVATAANLQDLARSSSHPCGRSPWPLYWSRMQAWHLRAILPRSPSSQSTASTFMTSALVTWTA